MSTDFKFATDTATLCIFDVAALRHRITDDPDWWVYPDSVQVEELNTAAAAFIDLGSDGVYSGILSEGPINSDKASFVLRCPSGKVFIGAGEEATSDGMEPDCTRGGLLLSLEQGIYQFSVALAGHGELQVRLHPTSLEPVNHFTAPLKLRS